MKKSLVLFTLFLVSLSSFGSDTVFVGSYTIPNLVNIAVFQNDLYVRTADEIFIWKEGTLKETDIVPEKRYSWFLNDGQMGEFGVYHTDFFPSSQTIPFQKINRLLPGPFYKTISSGFVGDLFYLAYQNNLLVYRVNNHYSVLYPGKSVRSIYGNDSSIYIATYDGIFKTSIASGQETLLTGSNYSNGEINEWNNHVYICNDNLLVVEDSTLKSIKSGSNYYHYRALRKYKGELLALRTEGIEVLDDSLRTKKVILEYESLSSMATLNELLLVGTQRGLMFVFNQDYKIIDSLFLDPITDISPFRDSLYISTSTGIYILNDRLEQIDFIEHPNTLKTIMIGDYLVFSALDGLYARVSNKTTPIIPNVEFNKLALYTHGYQLYAGSIFGLYVIDRNYLKDVLLPNIFKRIVRKEKSSSYILPLFGFLFALIISVLIIRSRYPRKESDYYSQISLESVEYIIRQNPNIQSVSHLAEALNTSTVQLNRKLKKAKTTPGKAIQEVKKEIAREMFAKGDSIQKIASRVGYTKRYVKQNFLK